MMRIIAPLILCSALMLVVGRYGDTASHSQTDAKPNPNNLNLIVQLGHSREGVSAVAFSGDGSLIVTGSCDKTAILWDAATGEELRRFAGHGECVNAVAVSPDNKFVLTGAGAPKDSKDNSARLWDISSGSELKRFEGHAEGILSVAFSPNGRRILTGGWDHTALLWDIENGRQLQSFNVGNNTKVTAVAFSPNGHLIALGRLIGPASLWDADTGTKILDFKTDVSVSDVEALSFSPDGKYLATGGDVDRIARIFDVESGRELKRLIGHPGLVRAIAFSPDGKLVLTGAGAYGETADNSIRLWDAATGREIRQMGKHEGEITSVAFSPNGAFALTGSDDGTATLWNVADGQLVRRFEGLAPSVETIALSPDHEHFMTGGSDGRTQVWDSASGKVETVLPSSSADEQINSAAFSPDGQQILTGCSDGTAKLWDVQNAAVKKSFRGPPLKDAGFRTGQVLSVNAVAFSPNGRSVATGSGDQTIRIWNVTTGQLMRQLGQVYRLNRNEPLPAPPSVITSIAFSPDGSQIVSTSAFDDRIRLWDVTSGKELKSLTEPNLGDTGTINAVAFSADGHLLVTGTANHATIWDPQTGKQLKTLPEQKVYAVAFSPDGQNVLTGSGYGDAKIWSVATGEELRSFTTGSTIASVAFATEERYVVTGSSDGVTRFFDAATGSELCRLISLKDDTWVVLDPKGRFDTNNLESVRGLHWIVTDTPFKALPIEVFMRDYYEPRLLPRLLKCSQERSCGKEFKPVRDLTALNRTQPNVKITEIDRVQNADSVNITVEVASAASDRQRDDVNNALQSGVYDLRLFRDGQIVGYTQPPPGQMVSDRKPTGDEDIEQWREITKVKLEADGKASITFSGIKLPHKAGAKQVEFSAYAFNLDRVKSRTDRKAFIVPPEVAPKKGRAYIISVGVNAYENSDWNLKYAANDAREIQRTLTAKLTESSYFTEVVPVSLISDYEMSNGQVLVNAKSATKHNIQSVLDLLAGRSVDADTVKSIPNADKLQKASPDDLVIISFSSHGYADAKGNFFFIPYDVGEGKTREITAQLLKHCTSSEELGLWLRDVDAGDIVMIVDACHSAASIQGEGFKPGPMGSRGLGQLSYDKGMRILTSTQSDDVALETDVTRQGLLSFALTSEGLTRGAADFKPKDQMITLTEWLEYGATRVPKLYEEIQKQYQSVALNELKEVNLGPNGGTRMVVFSRDGDKSSFKKGGSQQPSLFDFTRRRNDLVLMRTK